MNALQGEYYFFERGAELFTAYQLNERDAIQRAETIQTALIKFTFDDGHVVRRRTLYFPDTETKQIARAGHCTIRSGKRGARHE